MTTDSLHKTLARSQGLLPLMAGLVAVALAVLYAWAFLHAESEGLVAALILAGGAAAFLGARTSAGELVAQAADRTPGVMNAAIIAGTACLLLLFAEEHFALLMICTVMLYTIAALGLNIQFGYAGMVNFAGAAFFGIGAYTAAVMVGKTPIPPLLVLAFAGLAAALASLVLVVPVVRTRGHYSAVVTIAFSILFKTFLEVNDALGGPQGLAVGSMTLLGWDFKNGIVIGDIELSFYLNYAILSLALLALAFAFTRRLERSWIGLTLDAVRVDETASACFGVGIVRAKILAFTIGNVLVGVAGALYGMVIGFVAPTSFTFSDSLIFVAIVLLGGMGSPWGAALAAAIVVVLPEKLQMIQEYRFFLFALLVMLILLFRPDGLLPRGIRSYVPGWRPRP